MGAAGIAAPAAWERARAAAERAATSGISRGARDQTRDDPAVPGSDDKQQRSRTSFPSDPEGRCEPVLFWTHLKTFRIVSGRGSCPAARTSRTHFFNHFFNPLADNFQLVFATH